jgi:hypothetical protein
MINKKALTTLLAASFLMTACGGGGGGSGGNGGGTPTTSSISGTAATGAPMAGASITVKDVNGLARTATAAADGTYTVNVTDLATPLLIKATLNSQSHYAFALVSDLSGTINITPLTTLMTGNALGTNPETIFASYGGTQASNIAANSAAVVAAVQLITAALGIDEDPLRTAFAADHSGLDAVLDVLTVTINGNTATLSDALGNPLFTDDFTNATDIDVADVQSQQAVLDNLQAAVDEFPSLYQGLQTLIASLTSECGNEDSYKTESCSSLYVESGFLHGGETTPWDFFDDDGDSLPDEPGISVSFSDLEILERISSTEYRIKYTATGGWGDPAEEAMTLESFVRKNATTGLWQLAGDQQLVYLDRHYKNYFTPFGIVFDLVVKFKSSSKPADMDHVTVWGPGLPAEGVTITTSNFYANGDLITGDYRGVLCAPNTARTLTTCPNSNSKGYVIPGYDLTQAPVPLALNMPALYRYTVYDSTGAVISENRNWIRVVFGD